MTQEAVVCGNSIFYNLYFFSPGKSICPILHVSIFTQKSMSKPCSQSIAPNVLTPRPDCAANGPSSLLLTPKGWAQLLPSTHPINMAALHHFSLTLGSRLMQWPQRGHRWFPDRINESCGHARSQWAGGPPARNLPTHHLLSVSNPKRHLEKVISSPFSYATGHRDSSSPAELLSKGRRAVTLSFNLWQLTMITYYEEEENPIL